MTALLSVITLVSAFLLYTSDRQQRLLSEALPPAARAAGAVLAAGALVGWAWHLGLGVGLFTGFWVLALGAMALPMVAGHRSDGYRAAGRKRS